MDVKKIILLAIGEMYQNYTQLFWAIYFQKNKTINFKHGIRTKRTELEAHRNI